jgi:hypothetical protein
MLKSKEQTGLCDHVDRVAIHPSVKMGGVAIGRCERKVLPGLVVCAWHADPAAVTMVMRDMDKELKKLQKKKD